MNDDLLPIQKKILAIYEKHGGNLPAFRELSKLIGVSSTNTVHYHIKRLKESGYLQIGKFENGVVELNLKNLLHLENKGGVFVLLENKIPFFVSSGKNIMEDIFKLITEKKNIFEKIKNSNQKIMIAYHFIGNESERENLKDHLLEFYKNQKMKIL